MAKHIRRIEVKSPNKVEVVTFNVPDNAAGNISRRFETAKSVA